MRALSKPWFLVPLVLAAGGMVVLLLTFVFASLCSRPEADQIEIERTNQLLGVPLRQWPGPQGLDKFDAIEL